MPAYNKTAHNYSTFRANRSEAKADDIVEDLFDEL